MSVNPDMSGMVPWNPDLFGAAYDVNNPLYRPPARPPSYDIPPMMAPPKSQTFQRQEQQMLKLSRQLDYMKRSRNALIVVVVILCILFLAALIGDLLLAFPNALITSIDIKVTSTRTDLIYTTDPSTTTLVENTMCAQVKGVASTVANIEYCSVTSLEDASPGVRAYTILKTSLDGKDPSQVVAAVGEAIVRTAATDSTWNVAPSDISVNLPSYIPPNAISTN